MGVEITADRMTSSDSRHTARLLPDGRWELSWLPGRSLGQDLARIGMVLADTVGAGLAMNDQRWPVLDGWARQLGLSGSEAVVRVTTSDEVRARIARAEAPR